MLLLFWILLAFWLRIHNLDSFSFWTDEGLTPLRSGYSVADIFSNRIFIQGWLSKDTHPPLFYLLIHFSRKLFGESDFAYRYPSLLAGVLLVPLLFQFGRRLRDRSLGLVVALLTAISPLQIWYAQEARMYTLLVLLAAAASYLLWRALSIPDLSGAMLRRYLILYLVSAGLAFYTHYASIFLFATQGIFWFYLLRKRGHARLLWGMVLIAVLLAVPIIPYTVPRLFTGAEASYFYVPPLIMLQDVVHAFGQGITSDFSLPATKLLDLGALLLLILGVYGAAGKKQKLFLLTYVYAVVIGLMVGSLLKPMYQGARHIMVGSPGFLLLIGWGLVWLAAKARRPVSPRAAAVWNGSIVIAAAVTLGGPIISLNNLYNSELYIKNDFRQLIHYIEQHAGTNDAIIFNNAVLLPLHEHYQTRQDVAVTASPIYPYLSTGSIPQLEELAAEHERLWFVTDPPADERDKDRLVQGWLDSNLFRVDERNFAGRTTEVKVIAYATQPQLLSSLPQEAIPLSIRWPDIPAINAWQPHFSQPANLPNLWFDLFWEAGSALVPTGILRFQLTDVSGVPWSTQDLPLARPTNTEMPAQGIIRHGYYLPIPPGTPPGEYTLMAQPLASNEGPAWGETQPLGKISITRSNDWPVTPDWPFHQSALIEFENGLSLQALIMADTVVRPGHPLPLTLYWQSEGSLNTTELRYQLEIIGPNGDALNSETKRPGADWLDYWTADSQIKENSGLYFPPEGAPGQYRLRWRLFDGDEPVPGRLSWQPWHSQKLDYGRVTVKAWPMSTKLPEVQNILEAKFDSTIELYGYDLVESTGTSLAVTLFWRVKAVPEHNYLTFFHLVSVETGEIVTQKDVTPVDNLRPTRGWRVNEVIEDPYTLAIPPDLAPGQYQLLMGLSLANSSERLPIQFQGKPQANDQLLLMTVQLP